MDSSFKIMAFLGTQDADRAREFYGGKLGLRLLTEDNFALQFDSNGTMLRVTRVRDLRPASFTVLGWEVPDIVAAVEQLQRAGVTFEKYDFVKDELGIWTSPSGARVAWFKDPDGNILSLSQH
jgi:catechol 2,3-dioxygenase-like lactoylglutathione lyase family enzyme